MSRRDLLLAGIFAFVCPALGHIYVGRAGRGFTIVGLGWAAVVVVGLLPVPVLLRFVLQISILVVLTIYTVVDAVSLAKLSNSIAKESYEPRKYNRWYVYLGYYVFIGLLFSFIFIPHRGSIVGFESYRIPSGSMLPTLYIGDYFIVDVRDADPVSGDVVVFHYPRDSSIEYIMRVIGTPGDVISYHNKRLTINGQVVPTEPGTWSDSGLDFDQMAVFLETIDDSVHTILTDGRRQARSIRVKVPPGHYFVMGDNRDHSNDSRYWGFVPEDYIVGKAEGIWFSGSFEGGIIWSRIGKIID